MISGLAASPDRPSDLSASEGAHARLREVYSLASESFAKSNKQLCLVCLPVSAVAPESWLARLRENNNFVWAPPGGQAVVCGAGTALQVHASGPDRFQAIAHDSQVLWASVETLTCGRLPFAWEPRLLGGAAFSDSGCTAPHWQAFGATRFVLPRVTYAVKRGGAVLCLALTRSESGSPEEGAAHWLFVRAFKSLEDGGEGPLAEATCPEVSPGSAQDREAYQLRVADILSRITRGQVDKVVAAREEQLKSRERIDPLATIYSLRTQAPHCTRFAFQLGRRAFLGATPETLVRRQGARLSTEALAGTIGDDTHEAAHVLLNSQKDRREHQWVIAAIEQGLAPLCSQISRPLVPTVRRLRHLLHLCTPVEATLKDDVHILALAQVLHPSPAVGGVPKQKARAWIAQHEPFDRGWYSGVVGWFDRHGDGDLSVALRSGLVDDEGIRLYAGAGIVRESEPFAELMETSLKLTSLRAALRCHHRPPMESTAQSLPEER